jgi:hypothetical protein
LGKAGFTRRKEASPKPEEAAPEEAAPEEADPAPEEAPSAGPVPGLEGAFIGCLFRP